MYIMRSKIYKLYFRRRESDDSEHELSARLITQSIGFQAVDMTLLRQVAIERKMKNIFG